MNPIVLFSVCLVLSTFSACSARPANTEETQGRYIHMVQPYVHVHDNRELGQYVHIPNPYDGGYGPYSGLNNPYRHDESGNYDKYTTTSTTTRRPTTTTTTTVRPRLFNYYEEGGWKILRQEEEKQKHKYDFLYHTENGIYGEEKAHLHPNNGTAASGYYEYTGDDGELYRVNYKSDHRGFIPEGDHIPTPPPVPDAIKRALEYVAKKKETHGQVQSGHYEHRGEPIRRQNMPTIDRPLSPLQPKPHSALPTLLPIPNSQAPQPRAIQLPSLSSKRPADQLIQQTQLAQQSQPDQVPQVQVLLPQAEAPKSDEPAPVQDSMPVRAEEEQMQSDQPQEDQPQADQPQADQPQADEPQADQPHSESESQIMHKLEEPMKDEMEDPLTMEPSNESIVIVKPDTDEEVEVSAEASEVDTKLEPYVVAETLTDEDNFELTMA